jgi:hypothetical protein
MMTCFQKNGRSLARNFMCMALFFFLVLIPISTKAEIIIPIDHYPDESGQVIRPSEAYDEDISSYAHIRAVPNAEPLITYDFDSINSGDPIFLNMRVFSENFTNDTWGIKYSLDGGTDGTWITLKAMSSENIVIYLDIRENIGELDTAHRLSIGIFTDTKGKVDGGTINIYEIFAEATTSEPPDLYQSSYRFFENLSLGVAGVDEARAITTDRQHMYVAGFQPGGWRFEIRNLSAGALVQSVQNICGGKPHAILAHENYIYIVGDDYTEGNYQWRIEKWTLDTSNSEYILDPNFGEGGVVLSNPSEGDDTAYDIVIVGSSIYVVGSDRTHGDSQWRTEKRSIASGSVVDANSDIILSNPSNNNDVPYAIATDGSYLYIGGYDRFPEIGKNKKATSNAQWRLEKIALSDHSLVQTKLVNPFPTLNFDAAIKDIAVDENFIYLAGYQEHLKDPELFLDTAGRVEKRHLSDLGLDTVFNETGVKIIDPGYHDSAESIALDDSYIYIAGFSADLESGGDTAWRIEKWNKINGSEVYSIVHDIDSDYNDRAYGIALATVDSDDYMYIAGYEQPGLADCRIEIRDAADGELIAPLPQPLALQNDSAQVSVGEPFFLKMLINVDINQLPLRQGEFNLQVAQIILPGGGCSDEGLVYNDVGSTDNGELFFNTAHGFDDLAAKITIKDPYNEGEITRHQSYEIENPFFNGVSEILAGENGLWEFSLISKTAGNYCFRIVQANDGSALPLDGWLNYPIVIVEYGIV